MRIRYWLAVAGWCALVAQAEDERAFGLRVRASSVALVEALDAQAAAACLQPADPAARRKVQYTGGAREGVQIGQLPAAARTQVHQLIRSILSERGWQQAQAVAEQDGRGGLDRYYVAFFGDPRRGDFALRVAEHHLTLIHLELAEGEVTEFGPILLGSDPPVLWREEEQDLLALWESLGATGSGLLRTGRAPASEPADLRSGPAASVADLSPAARAALERVWTRRLGFFAEPVQARIRRLVEARGGLSALRLAYFNEPATRRCAEGGRWDWKLAGEGLLLDFETSRKHIHMSLWIR